MNRAEPIQPVRGPKQHFCCCSAGLNLARVATA